MMMNRNISGITLVELMVAVAVAGILLSGVATVYVGNRKAANLNTGIARIQENIRFIGELIAQDTRMAGYVGCRGGDIINSLNTPTLPELDIDTPLHGYDGDTDTASFPTAITDSGNVVQQQAVVGSDAFIVLRAGGDEFRIVSHNPNSAQFGLAEAPNGRLQQNDIVVVTDCFNTAVLQITNAIGSSSSITHNTGSVSSGPGNCWHGLGPYDRASPPSCGPTQGTEYTYSGDGRIMKMQATLYYVATSVSGQTTSLYRLGMSQGELNVREELIEGVESMQVVYGLDINADNIADRYVDASEVSATEWDNVASVRIGLLIRSQQDIRSANDSNSYTVAGTTISTSSTVPHAGDKKLRFSYTMTVKLRNKGVM